MYRFHWKLSFKTLVEKKKSMISNFLNLYFKLESQKLPNIKLTRNLVKSFSRASNPVRGSKVRYHKRHLLKWPFTRWFLKTFLAFHYHGHITCPSRVAGNPLVYLNLWPMSHICSHIWLLRTKTNPQEGSN